MVLEGVPTPPQGGAGQLIGARPNPWGRAAPGAFDSRDFAIEMGTNMVPRLGIPGVGRGARPPCSRGGRGSRGHAAAPR